MTPGGSKPVWHFDDFQAGQRLGSLAIPLDEARLGKWRSIYGKSTDAHRVPSGVLVAAMMEAYLTAVQPRPPGNVHASQKLTFGKPAVAGDRLAAEVTCVWKERRKQRGWVAFGVVLRNDDGDVLRGEICTVWAK